MSAKRAADSGETRSKAAKLKKKRTVEKRGRLQPRQAKLLQGIIEGKSQRQAALSAGYSERMANNPSELLDTVGMREALARLIAPPEKIAQRINEGLDAMETKFFQFKGEVTEARDVIAWGERRMYADLAAELKGLKANSKLEINNNLNLVRVTFTDVAACTEP